MEQDWHLGEGVKFERIRRITGYLVGTLDRFNNAKRCEEADRVKHGFGTTPRSMSGRKNMIMFGEDNAA